MVRYRISIFLLLLDVIIGAILGRGVFLQTPPGLNVCLLTEKNNTSVKVHFPENL